MALPWLRLIDVALNLTDVARRVKARNDRPDGARQTALSTVGALGGIETRLAGVVVGVLKEAFDRDSQRLLIERERMEAERLRAERLLKLELLRQAGERTIATLKAIGVVAMVGWLGVLLLAVRAIPTPAGRVMLGLSALSLLSALVCVYLEQQHQVRAMAVADERLSVESATAAGVAGTAAPWLALVGYAAAALGALM